MDTLGHTNGILSVSSICFDAITPITYHFPVKKIGWWLCACIILKTEDVLVTSDGLPCPRMQYKTPTSLAAQPISHSQKVEPANPWDSLSRSNLVITCAGRTWNMHKKGHHLPIFGRTFFPA